MILFVFTILLALAYAFLVGFDLVNLIIGYGLALLIVVTLPQVPTHCVFRMKPVKSGSQYVRFVGNLIYFSLDFVWDLTLSNFQLALDIWTPRGRYRPTLLEVPVHDLTQFETALLATRITLTPGTLSCCVSADRKFLTVHVMYPREGDMAAQLRRPIEILKR